MRSPIGIEVRNDSMGSGFFGAPRGNRTHRGLDICATPGGAVLSPVNGVVKRLGTCYSDDQSYRLIVIASGIEEHRILYVTPSVGAGDKVNEGDEIGRAQDVSARYDNRMIPHIHWEVLIHGIESEDSNTYSYLWVNPLEMLGIKR